MNFATCPACGAEYPDFHSPCGSNETLCDECGYCSDWTQLVEDLTLAGAKRVSRGEDEVH